MPSVKRDTKHRLMNSQRRFENIADISARFGLVYAVIPAIVLPLIIIFARTPYLALIPIIYLAITVLADEYLPRMRRQIPNARMVFSDFWLLLFGVNLMIFVVVALSFVNPSGWISLQWRQLIGATGGTSAGATEIPGWQLAGLVFTMGLMFAVTYNVAHDLIHRIADKARWGFGFLLLILVGDSQLSVSHVYGHHPNVCTPDDPATARRGESLYGFFLRSTLGQYREAWRFEVRRRQRLGKSAAWIYNRVFMGTLATVAFAMIIKTGFGTEALVCYLAACFVGKFFFESANYIQHYGLVREPGNRVQAHDSWDCTAVASHFFMFNQNNHSDHHLKAGQRYWQLMPKDDARQMPFGYITMILIANFPPAWFHLIDPLIPEHRPALPAQG